MIEEYTEEERAFREGLRQAAEAEEFDALEPTVFARHPRVSGWAGIAGAAAVVLVVLGGVSVLPGMWSSGSTAAPAAAPEMAPYAGGMEDTRDQSAEAGEPPMAAGGVDLGEPMPGFRWESFRDVAVQVPESWGYGVAPRSDWCAATDVEPVPSEPFVDLGEGGVRDVHCSGAVPADLLELNLQFWADGLRGPELSSPWSYRTVSLGDVTIAVATDGTQAGLVERILDSARQL